MAIIVSVCRAQYGAPTDFDEWAKIINDESWSWDQFNRWVVEFYYLFKLLSIVHRFFRKFEKYEHDSNFPEADASLKGSDGPMRVGYFPIISKASKDFVEACKNVSIPPSADFTQPVGVLGANKVCSLIIIMSILVLNQA